MKTRRPKTSHQWPGTRSRKVAPGNRQSQGFTIIPLINESCASAPSVGHMELPGLLSTFKMNYDLAKQLKDAGWKNDIVVVLGDGEVRVIAPSLPALIEACGDDFLMLQRNPIGSWTAAGGTFYGTHYSHQLQGESALEAVAKLWIALHQ